MYLIYVLGCGFICGLSGPYQTSTRISTTYTLPGSLMWLITLRLQRLASGLYSVPTLLSYSLSTICRFPMMLLPGQFSVFHHPTSSLNKPIRPEVVAWHSLHYCQFVLHYVMSISLNAFTFPAYYLCHDFESPWGHGGVVSISASQPSKHESKGREFESRQAPRFMSNMLVPREIQICLWNVVQLIVKWQPKEPR